jgi:3D-(3,5/4)-trihydroxycyclohexane-1,2-dione acylhydrolase (decyclizing)
MKTTRRTAAQAVIGFLKNQYVERDGMEHRFFAGCFGIFGHGIIAGIGQALQQNPDFPYYQARNEQAMVHTAAAYAKMKNRLSTLVCTSSIGPGATNMVTGAAAATINRIPVLLIPGDIFGRRNVAPVLQQLEQPSSQDVSVNDCFKPVSRYWDRINRPDQLIMALPEVMRVLTSQAETGTVTLAMPQDVQTEAYDYPEELFVKRVWHIARPRADAAVLRKAAEWIRGSSAPLIIAGGGVLYSDATHALRSLVEQTGIPAGETFAGKGSLPYDHPSCLGAVGATGTPGAAEIARKADLVIGIGTRYSDFTTASKTLFENPNVRFININITEFDAFKHAALPVVGDARAILEELAALLSGYAVPAPYRSRAAELVSEWDGMVEKFYAPTGATPMTQAEVVGAVNTASAPHDVMVCAAGSLPGDLHKLWRTRDPKGFHLEYGYSTMGYEIAGGVGVKMADPSREVYVMLGDGSYLMMSQEIITSIQEGLKLTIILLVNHGFASIGGLSESIGSARFGTRYRFRNSQTGQLDGDTLPVDLAMNARSLGATVLECADLAMLRGALEEAKKIDRTTVIVVETDLKKSVPGYAWWDVAIAEISESKSVQQAREAYIDHQRTERYFFP